MKSQEKLKKKKGMLSGVQMVFNGGYSAVADHDHRYCD